MLEYEGIFLGKKYLLWPKHEMVVHAENPPGNTPLQNADLTINCTLALPSLGPSGAFRGSRERTSLRDRPSSLRREIVGKDVATTTDQFHTNRTVYVYVCVCGVGVLHYQ